VDQVLVAVALIGLVMGGASGLSVNLFALIADVSPPQKVGGDQLRRFRRQYRAAW
jgi:hypothetical protein